MTDGTGSSQPGEPIDGPSWPVWGTEDGYAALARYVSAAVATHAGLVIRLESDDGHSPADLDLRRAERLYELLREIGVRYDREPWVPRDGVQLVRDPEWLRDNKVGTCLDVATTYAAMCAAAYVDVLLAVTDDHAFVVVTPGRHEEEGYPEEQFELAGFEESEAGVLEGDMPSLAVAAATGRVVAVEATWTADMAAEFSRAAEFEVDGHGDERVCLIDVPMLQATGAVPPLGRPGAGATIGRYIPSGGGKFRAYQGDDEVIEALHEATGSSVLLAKQGQGKSMIARHLAEADPFGAAWFLDASEPEALINSLAAAMLAEEGRAGETPDAKEREALAGAALALLRTATAPWLVVLDNADGDPTKLRKWIPVPGEKQHVLVTTTNPDWKLLMPNFTVYSLPDVDEVELEELRSPELSPLVDGRRLLLEAFRSLQASTGWSGERVAGFAPEPEDGNETARGPAAFWRALTNSPGFGDPELRLSAFAAYLPPDRQPISLLDRLVDRAAASLDLLEERGLIARDLDSRSIRLHRLFGAAIRHSLEHDDDLRQEVVLTLATDEEAREALDRYGDLATIARLDDCLAAIDAETVAVDERLGKAQHGVAELLELHAQTRPSGEAYARAERHLSKYPVLIADCRHGRARTVNQHHKGEEALLRQAVEWAKSARQILLDAKVEVANADRCLAMEGLLRKALARFPEPGETRVGVLRRALEILEEADESRRDDPDVGEDEKARSLFNLAGIRVDLAKAEPDRAETYLEEAEQVYAKVGAWRRRLYNCDVHPHIAACEAGLAYVDYYRAMLLPASQLQRSFWLRNSTDHAVAALKQWETLEGSIDLEEVPKSARFLTKVALARHASPSVSEKAPRSVFNEAMKELTGARIVFKTVPPLSADGTGVVAAIEAWARSVALGEVIRLFGDERPADLDLAGLLTWLEEFSERWNYRNGKERNLVTAPALEPVTAKVVKAAAAALGLVKGGMTPKGSYDHVLILGGLARACLARPLHAAKLIEEHKIEAGSITALGGHRELKGDELGLVERVTGDHISGEGVADEFEAMGAGARFAFELGAPSAERGEESDLVGGSWRVREYEAKDGMQVRIAAAPSAEPGERRTNTPDSIEWFATELAELRLGKRILMITSDIYVPYQHADALRVMGLPCEVEVDTAGIQPGDVDPRLNQVFAPHAYLQEMRSTILAFNKLFAVASGR